MAPRHTRSVWQQAPDENREGTQPESDGHLTTGKAPAEGDWEQWWIDLGGEA